MPSSTRFKAIKRKNEVVVTKSSNINQYRTPSVLELSSRPRREKEIIVDRCLRESAKERRMGG